MTTTTRKRASVHPTPGCNPPASSKQRKGASKPPTPTQTARQSEPGGASVSATPRAKAPRRRTNGQDQPSGDLRPETVLPADGAKAIEVPAPIICAPSHNGNGGHVKRDHLDTPAAVAQLQILQRQRVMCIRRIVQIENGNRAYVRTALGWNWDLPEKERTRLNREAATRVKEYTSQATTPPDDYLASFVLLNYGAQRIYMDARKDLEERMVALAAELPVADFCRSVRGFGLLGLAIIVGECDIGNWRTVSGVWKRFGLAPKHCYDAVREDGTPYNGKPRQRRSRMWTIGDSLLKGNDGKYRQAYEETRRKLVEREPAWLRKAAADSKDGKDHVTKQCHLYAQRIAEKELLKDIWIEWRRQCVAETQGTGASPRSKTGRGGHLRSESRRQAAALPAETKAGDHHNLDDQRASVPSPKRSRGQSRMDALGRTAAAQ